MTDKTVEKYDHAFFKVWFSGSHTSRNFSGVMEIERNGSVLFIRNDSGTTYVLNWDNINMIEEIHDE